MFLTDDMKKIMAWCYTSPNVGRYEFVMDKRKDEHKIKKSFPTFICRLFLEDKTYWSISIETDGSILVTENTVTKSCWRPSYRVTYINKYLRKYRMKNRLAAKFDNLEDLISILNRMDFNPQCDGIRASVWTGDALNRMEMY